MNRLTLNLGLRYEIEVPWKEDCREQRGHVRPRAEVDALSAGPGGPGLPR